MKGGAKSEKNFPGGSGAVSSNENNGINEPELEAREIWLRIRKKQQTTRKSSCRHSALKRKCLRELQVPATEKGGHTGWRNRQGPGLQAVHAM